MSQKNIITFNQNPEKALIVGVDMRSHQQLLSLEDSLAELSLLANTAGVEVVGELTQKLDTPNANTFIGSGKVEELKILSDELDVDLVIFDEELSPRHQRELEAALGSQLKILDRTALILDIFAQHAHTREGMLQVELAQYEYRLPRLTRAWTHLARQAGGGGGRTGSSGGVGLRGPGETQLEVDRREVRSRISKLKEELEKVSNHRLRYRSQRKKSQIPVISLVGYTNAGKSTLMNTMARADVLVADQLFATLDPITRKVELPNGQQALLTDTVGFIQKLPTQLVAAFRATLEEISEADLLLHVVDINHANALSQARSVLKTLEEIGAGEIPIITIFNKIDMLKDPNAALEKMQEFPNTFAISAITGQGLDALMIAISSELYEKYIPIRVFIPYKEGQLFSLFHEHGHVSFMKHEQDGALLEGMIPSRYYSRYAPFLKR